MCLIEGNLGVGDVSHIRGSGYDSWTQPLTPASSSCGPQEAALMAPVGVFLPHALETRTLFPLLPLPPAIAGIWGLCQLITELERRLCLKSAKIYEYHR